MSALLAPAEVRRKLATYGKPSRRQLHGLSPPRDSLSLSPRHRPALKPKDGQLRPSFVRKTIEVAIVVSPTKSARTGHNEAQGDGHPRAPSGALGEAKAKEHDPTLTISPQAQVETGPPAEEAPCVQWTEQAPKRAEEATALGRDHELSLFDFQSSDEDSWSWTADASPSKKPPLVIKKPSLLKASKTKLNQAEGRANGLALVLEQSRTNTKRKHGASHHAQPHSAASRTTTTLGLHMDNGSLGATNDHRASILCATTIPTSFVPELLGPDRKKIRLCGPQRHLRLLVVG
ncbi:MAG: hypothetical protein M1826_007252 [Phylliscum demangeonii]|nr:MAG: hypothetical protein M1826_007252 [Phylliscum demangeonii]